MLNIDPPQLELAGWAVGYCPRPGLYDEAFDASGQPRAHWQPFIDSVGSFAGDAWRERADTLRRWLRDLGAPRQPDEARQAGGLELDPIPLLISPREWSFLETGLRQRARVLSRALKYCLGPRQGLIESGIPPALLYANPAFLRPCTHAFGSPDNPLSFFACDLIRSHTGAWTVLGDHTRGPQGAGIALQNRLALSRVLSDQFRESRVRRLAEFFHRQQEWLRLMAPRREHYPNVVLLTPGPYNPAWPEHVFLARYLGFTLVEGADLTVRDRRVCIKTLEGLQPVDVILRYLDDGLCDPLELRSDSVLGVPGLLEAIRAGEVSVANLPGSGLLEANAWNAYLPSLCRRWLGEDLLLPCVDTGWCGEPAALERALAGLSDLAFRPAFPGLGSRSVLPRHLPPERRQRLLRSLREQPHEYVSQSIVQAATVPTLTQGRLEARPYRLRVLLAGHQDDWAVMPGGIAHLLDEPEPGGGIPMVSGVAKDVWVLSDETVQPLTLLTPADRILRPERHASELPSRVADDLFWLGRYAERLEDMVRVLRCVLGRLTEETSNLLSPDLLALARLLVGLDLLPKNFQGQTFASLEKEILHLIYHTQSLGTVREVMGRLRQIAFSLRDRFSGDTWRILVRLGDEASRRPTGVPSAHGLLLLNNLIVSLAAFSGMEMENMTRGHGWLYPRRGPALGARHERHHPRSSGARLLRVPGGRAGRHAGDRGQLHDLPAPVFLPAAVGAAAGPAPGGRHQPQGAQLPVARPPTALGQYAARGGRRLRLGRRAHGGNGGRVGRSQLGRADRSPAPAPGRRPGGDASVDGRFPPRRLQRSDPPLFQPRERAGKLMKYRVVHRTEYIYDTDVPVSHHLLRLTPRSNARQRCLEHELRFNPSPSSCHSHTDYFGNRATFVALEGVHRRWEAVATSVVEAAAPGETLALGEPSLACVEGAAADLVESAVLASEYRFESPLVPCRPEFGEYARASFPPGRPLAEAVRELTRRIFQDFKFDPRATNVTTPVEEVFRERRGVCQDFAHVQIACLRSLQVPARYVSGYLETAPPPGQPKLVGADASHAWVSYFDPERGWTEVDPTNDLLPTDRHIVVAYGRDFGDVSPVRGVIVGSGRHRLRVGVDVTHDDGNAG